MEVPISPYSRRQPPNHFRRATFRPGQNMCPSGKAIQPRIRAQTIKRGNTLISEPTLVMLPSRSERTHKFLAARLPSPKCPPHDDPIWPRFGIDWRKPYSAAESNLNFPQALMHAARIPCPARLSTTNLSNILSASDSLPIRV